MATCSNCYRPGHTVTTCPELISADESRADRRERWKMRRRDEGRCITCGADAGGKRLCRRHQAMKTASNKRRYGRRRATA